MTLSAAAPLPTAWETADVIDGAAPVEKAELVGVPFRITSVYFSVSAAGVHSVWAEAENVDGETFTFTDSSGSNGVRPQIIEYLKSVGKDAIVDSPGEIAEVSLVAPKGLRKSEYPNPRDPKKTAFTWYLTTSGKSVTKVAAKAKK